jgi:hypothetical protein
VTPFGFPAILGHGAPLFKLRDLLQVTDPTNLSFAAADKFYG